MKICPVSQQWHSLFGELARAKAPKEEKRHMTDIMHEFVTLVLRCCGDECPTKKSPLTRVGRLW